VSKLRQTSAQAHGDAGDRVQGWGLVQDRQPARAEGRRREQAGRGSDGRRTEARVRREARWRVEARGRRETGDRHEARGRDQERRVIEGGRRILTIARRVVGGFLADDGPFLAGAIAYQIFFALIPLLALIIGIFGFIYGTQEAELELARIVGGLLPAATGQETKLVGQLVQGRALSLSLGLAGTLLTVTAILGSIDTAMSHILGREGRRAFVRERLNSTLFVILVFVLAIASFAVSFGVQLLAAALVGTGLRGVRLLFQLVSPLVGLGFGFWFFYLVFRFAPRRPVRRRAARQAALVSAVLWEVAKVAFGFLTSGLGIFEAYGALAFAAGLLTWIYVTAVIILIGAEVVKAGDA
jgi:membrane protein